MRNFLRFHKVKINVLAISLILCCLLAVYQVLLYKNFVIDSAGNMRTTIAGFGDIPYHLTQMSKFAFSPFNTDDPIFTGTKLRYSFVVNLLSGWLLRATRAWTFSVNSPVMFFGAGSMLLVFFIYRSFLKSSWAALWTLILFYLGSGWGAYDLVRQQVLGGHGSLGQFFNYLINNNISTILRWGAVYPQQNIVWGAPLSLVFLHQRSFVMGFFVFTIVLWYLMDLARLSRLWALVAIGFLIGLTPLIHIHTFVILVGVLGVWALQKLWIKDYLSFRKLLIISVTAAVVAAPQLYYLMAAQPGLPASFGSFLAFRLGWMVPPTIGSVVFPPAASPLVMFGVYLKFLWVNLGLLLPFFILAGIIVWAAKKRQDRPELALWWLMAAAIFILLQLVRLQPWDFDDNKLVVYFAFFAAPVIVAIFWRYLREYKITVTVVFALYFLLSISTGVLDILPRLAIPLNQLPVMFTLQDRIMANYIIQDVPQQDLILTSETPLNPVNALAGRSVLVGYGGWLWTEGVVPGQRERDIENFYADPSSYQNVVQKYNIKYIMLDSDSITQWHAQPLVFDQLFQKVFQSGDLILYRVD